MINNRLTKELKEMWLKELRDPANQKIIRKFAGRSIDRPRSYTEFVSIDDRKEMLSVTCLCAIGCLIKAHAKQVDSQKNFIGIDIISNISAPRVNHIYTMNDVEDKSLAEIACWVAVNVPHNEVIVEEV